MLGAEEDYDYLFKIVLIGSFAIFHQLNNLNRRFRGWQIQSSI